MKDYLVRIVTREANIRAIACVTTKLTRIACQKHHAAPTAAVALGRALTGGALMGALLKGTERVALKFEGNGPLKKILVESTAAGDVRGYVGMPEVDLPLREGKIDVAAAIGHAGFLTVTKDLGLKEPYKGIVQLYTSEIAEDLAFYFAESEQIPSAVGLGALVGPEQQIGAAGGFLVQSLPPADDALIETLISQIEQMPPITELLLQGNTPEQILEQIFTGIPFDILQTQPIRFRCSCSKQRMEQALIALGPKDLEALRDEQGQADIVCEFCRSAYTFSAEELQHLQEAIN